MKKYLKSFWNWLKDLTTLDESAAELYGEVKSELVDVKKAANNVVNQSKDVVDAVKGKKKRGRKPNYKTKTNNSKKRKK